MTSCTEGEIKFCTWLREISSCSCLTVLSGPAWVLLSKKNKSLFPPLYIRNSVLYRLCGTERIWGKYGEYLGKNQHITHFFPRSCQKIPHPHNISAFTPTISPKIVNISEFSLFVPHSKINILSTNQDCVNGFLSKKFSHFKVGR